MANRAVHDRVGCRARLELFGAQPQRVAAVAEASPQIVDDAMARLNEELATFVDAWGQLRSLVGTVIVGVVALLIVLFGVPFGLGMLVGRVTKSAP